ncbi:response regulator transcription factor [Chloroflexi bacterium TSY]|nr:response regulator transcription factor [Chloroflexi bacterium TSY]
MTRLLLIDDEPVITEPLARRLTSRGYEVAVASDGKQGLEMALTSSPHLVILDVMMPEMDGWDVCRHLREQSTVPILMLTALDDEFDRITGLDLGADDYLAKPFSTNELIARINALLRRVELDQQSVAPTKTISVGNIILNLDHCRVEKAGQTLTLRYKEFELLSLLMANAGTPVTRAKIFDEVWGTDWLGNTRTLDVHIRWLREKLEENPSRPRHICTVRNVGYVFNTTTE